MRTRSHCFVLGAILTMALTGCDATSREGGAIQRASRNEFASRRIIGTMNEVQPVAERVFRSHFLIDAEASSTDHLVSRPTEVEGRGEAHNIRDRIRLSPSRQRQTAEMRIEPDGPAVAVRVSVRSQRLETAERASFAGQRGDDRPNTAIDRPGPGGVDNREVWVSAGRDIATEREVLNEVQTSLGSQPAQNE